MRLRILRLEAGFVATVVSSDGSAIEWEQATPVVAREIIDALGARGWHQQDIGDAFYEADPDWVGRS